MDIGSILLGLTLLLVVAFIIAGPLLAGSQVRDRQPGPADQLRVEQERVLTHLRDLDFDHATGKISDDDYSGQRAQLVTQGVEVLKQLDGLGANIEAQPAAAPRREAAMDDEIEAAVAQRRAGTDVKIEAAATQRQAGAHACGRCGAKAMPDDRFCPQCGLAQNVTCADCGRIASAGDQFCGGCGLRLPAPGDDISEAQVRGE